MLENEKSSGAFEKIDSLFLRVTRLISYGSGVCLCFIMILAFCNVISSKLFNHAISNATDIIAYMNVPICFLSIAYVQLDRGHTNIMLLQQHFHPILAKIIRVFSNLLGAFVSAIVGWRAIIQMNTWLTTNATASSNINGIRIWPYAGILAFGYLLLAVCFLWSIVREFAGRPDGKEADSQ